MLMLSAYSLAVNGSIQITSDYECWYNLLLLGLVPTALSNICVTISLKLINSTIVAILGAFEPLTAMAVGIMILGEPCSIFSLSGAAMILIAVGILTVLPKLKTLHTQVKPEVQK